MVIFDLYEITMKRDSQSLEYQVQLTARADSKITAEVESILAPGNLRTALNNQALQGDLKVYPWYSGFEIDLENTDATVVNYEIGERQTSGDDECYRLVTINYQQSIIETTGIPAHEQKRTDPIDWEPEVIIREVTRDVAATALTFLGAYQIESVASTTGDGCLACLEPTDVEGFLVEVDNNVVKMEKNSCTTLMTTAGERLTPLEVPASDDEITIVRWTLESQSSDYESCFKNTINKEEFTIDLPKQKYKQTFARHTVRLNAIQRELKEFTWQTVGDVQQRRLYWEKRYVLMFRPGGWHQDVVNAGHFRAAGVDDPKEGGGLITLSDLLDTEPLNVAIRRDGFATGTHMLDLNGQVEKIDVRSTLLRYIEPRTDFRSSLLNLPTTEKIDP